MTRIRAMQWGALAAGVSFALTVFAVLMFSQGQSGRMSESRPVAPATQASMTPAPPPPSLPVVPVPLAATSDNLRMTNDVRVYQMVKNAVVNIVASHTITQRLSTGNPVFDMMPLDMLPFSAQDRQRLIGKAQVQSLGSGFVIHPSGYIVTNEHVVEQGTDIECVFVNGDKLAAHVIATDNEHDLAVLKVTPPEGKPLSSVALGSSEDLMIGEPVYAIGNPFGYAGTMTRGIISAVDRSLTVGQGKSYTGLIQTDASINPGNSGGPLLNAYGQVIGINTAIRADAQGIGFAIAVSNMRDLLPAFLNPEALNRAQIGFTLEERRTTTPPANVAAEVFVKQVQADSEAQKKGLKAGDVIQIVNGVAPTNVVDALVALASAKPGDSLVLKVQRGSGTDGRQLDMVIPVSKAPVPPVEELMLTKMGVKGQTVSQALASKYGLAMAQGVYIDTVKADSPAARCGLQVGDVLFQLGRYYVNSPEDVATLLKTVNQPIEVRIGILRGNALIAGTIALK